MPSDLPDPRALALDRGDALLLLVDVQDKLARAMPKEGMARLTRNAGVNQVSITPSAIADMPPLRTASMRAFHRSGVPNFVAVFDSTSRSASTPCRRSRWCCTNWRRMRQNMVHFPCRKVMSNCAGVSMGGTIAACSRLYGWSAMVHRSARMRLPVSAAN